MTRETIPAAGQYERNNEHRNHNEVYRPRIAITALSPATISAAAMPDAAITAARASYTILLLIAHGIRREYLTI